MNTRKLTLTTLATLCTLAGLLALVSTPALASKESYGLEGSFGSATSTTVDPEPLSEPAGVAVNDSTGEVYVVDKGNERVERFSSTGTYLSQFNGSVGLPTGVFTSPQSIAVDNSSDPSDPSAGDVYVADPGHGAIDKFTAAGAYVSQLTGFTELDGLAVGPSGDLWVEGGEGPKHTTLIERFDDAITNSRVSEWYTPAEVIRNQRFPFETAPAIAVDSQDNVYLESLPVNIDTIYEFTMNGELTKILSENIPLGGLAVEKRSSNVFAATQKEVYEYAPLGLQSLQPSARFGLEAGLSKAGNVAVRSGVGTVYVTDTAKNVVDVFSLGAWPEELSVSSATSVTNDTATLNGIINPNGARVTSCRFEYGTTTGYGQSVPCAQTPEGTGSVPVSANVSGLEPNAKYHYRLVVGTSTGAVYDSLEEIPTSFTTLEGPPDIQEEPAYVSSRTATMIAEVNTGGLPGTYGFEYGPSTGYGSTTTVSSFAASSGTVALSTKIEGLDPQTTYHFRATVTNKDGTTTGADSTFTTLDPVSLVLPDGRGYELVSPLANADGNVFVPGNQGEIFCSGCTGRALQASTNGDAVMYAADPLATGGSGHLGTFGGEGGNQYVATRDSGGGWSPFDLSTSGFDGAPFEALFSDELSNSGTTTVPTGTHRLSFGVERLIDSVGGRNITVNVLPNGTLVPDAIFGSLGSSGEIYGGGAPPGVDLSHVISADGSRIFWIDLEEGPEKNHVFVRENDQRTVPVSVGAAKFWTASPDGRYAFYTERGKLWRFDLENETREELERASAEVLSVVGTNETGEDGAYVYFVANGVLGDGAKHGATPGTCTIESEFARSESPCHLYVRHAGVTTFIATLDPRDLDSVIPGSNNVEGVAVASVGDRSAEVTPDGRALLFVSQASLTGYANDGAREAYVYDAVTGRLSCASCNPTGVPPTALRYRPLRPSGHSTYMTRWISEDGKHVFFESAEALVPQDTNGAVDVYEWEQDGTGSCGNAKGCAYLLSGGSSADNSYLLDASASGDDVFMISRAELVPEDRGETYEVYDARVGAERPVEEPACTGTGCQGLPAPPPFFATPSSATFAGVGNFSSSPSAAAKSRSKPKPAKCRKGFHKDRQSGKCVGAKSGKSKTRKSIHVKGSK